MSYLAEVKSGKGYEARVRSPVHSAEAWADAFQHADVGERKLLRMLVQQQSFEAVNRHWYIVDAGPVGGAEAGRKVELDMKRLAASVRGTSFHPTTSGPGRRDRCRHRAAPFVHVVEGDCLDVGVALQEVGFNPAVLVMASRSHPGGGYKKGAGAQEENICRRTTLWQNLEDPDRLDPTRRWRYPLPDFGGVYSPDVCVFRSSEATGYAFLPAPRYLSFINVAAFNSPPVESLPSGELRLSGRVVGDTKRKMIAILDLAASRGHDAVVLGAFGCGAFGNPPRHIAELFREVLATYEWRFTAVVFAILNDKNAFRDHNPEGNVRPFATVFATAAHAFADWRVDVLPVAATTPPPEATDDSAAAAAVAAPTAPQRQ